jgi:hypothetical protein
MRDSCGLTERSSDSDCCQLSCLNSTNDRLAVHGYNRYIVGAQELLNEGSCQVALLCRQLQVFGAQSPFWADFGKSTCAFRCRSCLPRYCLRSHVILLSYPQSEMHEWTTATSLRRGKGLAQVSDARLLIWYDTTQTGRKSSGLAIVTLEDSAELQMLIMGFGRRGSGIEQGLGAERWNSKPCRSGWKFFCAGIQYRHCQPGQARQGKAKRRHSCRVR